MRRGKHRIPWAAATVLAALACTATARPAGASRGYQAEAKRLAARQIEQFGEDYKARYDSGRHILYVSALDDAHLGQTMQLLSAFADGYRRTLPSDRGKDIVTVVLPTADDYQQLELPFPKCVGFYNFAGRRLVSVDRGRTLVHEFTHALHHADMAAARQKHPIWITEGLATLFESSRITPSGLVPQVDLRLVRIQRAIRENKAFELKQLLSMGRKPFMSDAGVAYAQSRYVMFYLYERGRLDDFYRRYKQTFTRDPHGVKAFEWAVGARLSIFERTWRKWVEDKQLPRGERRSGRGKLGLEVKRDARGAKIVGIQDGSAAETAGRLKVGDIIEKFNGLDIRNATELVAAIRSAGSKRTVEIKLFRGGRRMTVIQPLG